MEEQNTKRITVIASINMDLTTKSKPFPQVGETVFGRDTQHIITGMAALRCCTCLSTKLKNPHRVGIFSLAFHYFEIAVKPPQFRVVSPNYGGSHFVI